MNGFVRNLPALQIVVPLLAAPLCFLIRRASWVRAFAVVVSWAGLLTSSLLLRQVLTTGPIVYRFGGWARPYGIEYVVDTTNAFVLLVISFMAAVLFPAGTDQASRQIPAGREYLFHAAALLCLTGLLGVTITGDVFNVFVFLEIASLSSYILISLGRDRRALTAAFSYLVMGTVGATFLLIGIGLMYQLTGTLNMADMADRLPVAGAGTRTLQVAIAFVVVGISVKLAVFPLYAWLPNAYTYAPPVVSAFLAGTATKVAYYLLLRFGLAFFGRGSFFGGIGVEMLLLPLSFAGIFLGSIAAIYQSDLKRLLAFSSIAQIGYMTLGLSLVTVSGVSAGLLHVFNHALMKGALFMVAACVAWRIGGTRIEDMRGLGRSMPLSMAALVVAGLSMVGVPGTAGFVSKWVLVNAALEQGSYVVAGLVLLSSLLTLVYVWRLVEAVYFQKADREIPGGEAPLRILLPTWILAGASLYFGVFSGFPTGVASRAAAELMAGLP